MNKELKEQAVKEWKEWYVKTHPLNIDLDSMADFWLSLIDKTVQSERERIVKAVWEADDMFDRGESWSHGIREHLISIITNKNDINNNK